MTKKHMDSDVHIIGGGLTGLTLASILGLNGIKTVIFDSLDQPTSGTEGDRRTTALMECSVALYENIGIWKDIKDSGCPLVKMKLLSTPNTHTVDSTVCFDALDVNQEYLAYNMDNHALRVALCNLIETLPSVTHLFQSPIDTAIKTDTGYTIEHNNTLYHGSLTVGADGRNSRMRNIANLKTNVTHLPESAIVFNVRHSKPHNNASTEFMYPQGAFTFVPMPSDNTHYESAIVWIESPEIAEQYVNNKDLLFKKFQEKAQGIFGTLEIISSVQNFPLNHIMAQEYVADNMCLIGESHHGLTPVAAQGLNLSLRDVAVLSDILITANKDGISVADKTILQRYSRNRILDIKSRDIGTFAFHKISRSASPAVNHLKKIAFKALNTVQWSKNTLVRIGLSFPGGTPKYMQKNTPVSKH